MGPRMTRTYSGKRSRTTCSIGWSHETSNTRSVKTQDRWVGTGKGSRRGQRRHVVLLRSLGGTVSLCVVLLRAWGLAGTSCIGL
jgi:hypothetical protein